MYKTSHNNNLTTRMGSQTLSATDFIKHATGTALHFGFHELHTLKDEEVCRSCDRKSDPKIPVAQRRLDALHGLLAGGAAAYFEHGLAGLGGPALFYDLGETRTGDIALALHIIGVEKSIAEALLLHTIRSLYNDLAYPEHVVHITSLGDRESLSRYARELGNYLKKRMDFMPPQSRELMKEHVLLALQDLIERKHELADRAPSSLEYLNEQSRKHFREIIEYLDFAEAPYEIDTKLTGHHLCYSHTLFKIDAYTDESREQLAPLETRGGRYEEFMYQHARKHIPAVGAVVTLRERKVPQRLPRAKARSPQLFIVQLGFGPKLRSLSILDELKRAQIPVFQSIASDSLSAQLDFARRQNVPYTIILGQKEYVDGNVILRDMRSSSQEHVPIANLVAHLKKTIRV